MERGLSVSPRDRQFMSALIYFERVAAQLSFKKAAADLCVTTSAVSHQISALEAMLEARLLERSPRQVSLTREGLQLASQLSELFQRLESVAQEIKHRRILRVSVGPFLSTRWLLPRLASFENEAGEVRVDLRHHAGWPNLQDVDMAIVWCDDPPVSARAELLFSAEMLPVFSPRFSAPQAFWEMGLPALHYRDYSAWACWLEKAGAPLGYSGEGEVFDDPNLVMDAAAHGRGVALGFLPFVSSELESGRLKVAHALRATSPSRYWMVPGRADSALYRRFAKWLMQEAEGTKAGSFGPSQLS